MFKGGASITYGIFCAHGEPNARQRGSKRRAANNGDSVEGHHAVEGKIASGRFGI